MKESSLFELLNRENKWFSVKVPPDLEKKVIASIEEKIYRSFFVLKWLRFVTLASLAGMICFMVLFFYVQNRPKIVFVYPHSGKEKRVYLNNNNRKIPMVLDEEKGLWKVVVRAPQGSVSECEFVVEEVAEENIDVDTVDLGLREE